MSQGVAGAAKLRADLARLLGGDGYGPGLDFLVSSLTEHNRANSTEEVVEWLEATSRESHFDVEPVALDEMRGWRLDPETGDLGHESGGFFRIRGLEVEIDDGRPRCFSQPIIDQPEVGVLGFLVQAIDGVLHFLTQAKVEPGNLDSFLLTPTVTATRSNFMRVHGGKPIPYIEHFLDAARDRVLVDQLQSEQCARFFRKRNRNMVVRVPDDADIELRPGFRWLTLGQLRRLARRENTVNMTARSVIAAIPFDVGSRPGVADRSTVEACLGDSSAVPYDFDVGSESRRILSAQPGAPSAFDDAALHRRFASQRFARILKAEFAPLARLEDWSLRDGAIVHSSGGHFSVLGLRIAAESREVASWDQPVVRHPRTGEVALAGREIGGVLHWLVQLKTECGSRDHLDLAPTVQCLPGTDDPTALGWLERIETEYRMEHDVVQLEEGARFHRMENRNRIVLADPVDRPADVGEAHVWMTLHQLKRWLATTHAVNVEARSVLSML